MDILGTIANFFNQNLNLHPLYYKGVQVGVMSTVGDACNGTISFNPGVSPVDPWLLTTKGLFGVDTALSEYCVSKNIIPHWAATGVNAAGQKTVTVTEPNGMSRTYIQRSNGSFADPGVATTVDAIIQNKSVLIGGGAALLALLFLRRR